MLIVIVVAALQADDGRFFMVTKDGQTRAGNEKQMWFVRTTYTFLTA